jgi:hypothetical protein
VHDFLFAPDLQPEGGCPRIDTILPCAVLQRASSEAGAGPARGKCVKTKNGALALI